MTGPLSLGLWALIPMGKAKSDLDVIGIPEMKRSSVDPPLDFVSDLVTQLRLWKLTPALQLGAVMRLSMHCL